ncbi:MAG: hypothetical protein AB7S81_03795 [Bdellovibrionales bacterium]
MASILKKLYGYKVPLLIFIIILVGITLPSILKEMSMDIEALKTTCQNGNEDEDIAACTEIINSLSAKEDDVVNALVHRTEFFYNSSQFNKALADIEELITLRPKMSAPYSLRANIFEIKNKIKKAAESHAAAAKREDSIKEKTDSLAFSGILYHAIGEKALAKQKIDSALQIDPEAVQAFDMTYHINIKEGKIDEALMSLDKKLQTHPFDTGWLSARAIIKMLKHNYDGAVEDIQEAISLDQRDPYYVLWLHIIRCKQKKSNLAELKAQTEYFGSTSWPAPIFKYFLEALLNKA